MPVFIYARFMPKTVRLFASDEVKVGGKPLLCQAHPRFDDAQYAIQCLLWAVKENRRLYRPPLTFQGMHEACVTKWGDMYPGQAFIKGDGKTSTDRVLIREPS